jgi:hypothetical protein
MSSLNINECKCEEEFGDFILNVGRQHFACCKLHETYRCIGENLFSGWLEESADLWRRNVDTLSIGRPRTPEDGKILLAAYADYCAPQAA